MTVDIAGLRALIAAAPEGPSLRPSSWGRAVADEELVAELAAELHKGVYWAAAQARCRIGWPGQKCSPSLIAHEAQDEDLRAIVDAALAWLAERGRLTPDGAQVGEQWEARCHGDDSDGIRLHSQYAEPSREQAEEWAREQIGRYGITRYTVRRREVRRWPDGSSWTGPWVAVAEETTREEPT